MIIDEALFEFLKSVVDVIKDRIPKVSKSNMLKKPMIDFCRFVDEVKVGDDLKPYMASFVSAINLAELITTEDAEEKLKWLRKVGVYGAWEKRNVLELMKGRTLNIDLWINDVKDEPGDLVIPTHLIEEIKVFATFSEMGTVGGVQ